jgi:hypothetical protein
MDSILTTTKELSGVMLEYDNFDKDLVMYINSVFMVLKQLGVGPAEGFMIKDASTTWEEFLPNNTVLRESVKAYMGNKVRLQFDPPTSSALLEALTRNVNEFEWRLNVEAETI